jgi:hypothetical protein
MYELIPAFALSLIVTTVVSRVTRAPEDTEAMFHVMSGTE